ncbi:MAG TPA: hypothetical protein VGI42_00970 [Chthoniobacterales bacterium]|jgi:hypothetical protein
MRAGEEISLLGEKMRGLMLNDFLRASDVYPVFSGAVLFGEAWLDSPLS